MANDYMAKLAADLDGMTMGGLASKGRYGDTMIAHINPQEAQMLMDKGGAGTINPMTGLLEFYDGDEAGFGDGGYAGSGDFGDDDFGESTADIGGFDDGPSGSGANEGGADDGTYTEEQLTTLATLPGLTDLPYTDEGLGGPDELLDRTLSPSIEFQRQDFLDRSEKGELTKAEELLYTQLLNTGLIGSEAIAKMAELLSTPGVKGAVESGYSEGYQYGGILGDALAAQEDALGAMSDQIKAAQKRQKEKEEEIAKDFDAGYEDTVPTDYFGGILDTVKDYFVGPSIEDKITMGQAVQDAGYTFNPMSDAEKYVGQGISYLTPGPIGFVKGIGDAIAFATDSRVLGNVDTPYGTFQLTESGDLQTTDFMGTGDVGGNEPTITKKRKEATKPKEEEEKEEEEDKPYFPEISTATLTPSEIQTITNIYGPDSYLLNENQTGLRTLV